MATVERDRAGDCQDDYGLREKAASVGIDIVVMKGSSLLPSPCESNSSSAISSVLFESLTRDGKLHWVKRQLEIVYA